jgi:hypothetical protein
MGKEGKHKGLYLILGILIILFLFLLIETINPYTFLGDDNASQFLPNILEGMRSLFSGHLPSINLHQLMGTKVLEIGTYAVLYPPMILSYFFSHFLFNNDFLTIDIFFLIHIILGFIFSFLFLNLHLKKYLASFLGALAFVFSGYGIGLSIAWYYVIPVILFLPLILYLNEKTSKYDKKSMFFLGIIRGIFFYAGNVQYFAFTLFFEFVYFLIREYQNDWKNFYFKFKYYIFSLLITFIILLPLLFSQINVSLYSPRGNIPIFEYLFARGAFPTDTLGSIIFPSLLAWSPFLFRYGPLSYSGTLFSLLFFIGGIFLLKKYKKYSFKNISPIFWCGLISIILSWGIIGIFYSLGVLIPFVKNFGGPFKFIIFANFFIVSFGAIVFSKILENKRIKKSLIFIVILAFSILLISNVMILSQKSSSNYFEKLPLNTSYFEDIGLKDYRAISVATGSDFSPKISSSSIKLNSFPESYFLSKNFATYFSVDHISGYEPFRDKLTVEKIPVWLEGVSDKHLNLTTLKEYSVKYVIIFKEGLSFHTELANLSKLYENGDFLILEIPDSRGYVFYKEGNLEYTRLVNGFSLNTSFEKTENVTINLLYKKGYICKINGEKVPYFQDSFGRMAISVSSGENNIVFFYSPKDFIIGCLISVFLIFIVIIMFIFRRHLERLVLKVSFKRFFIFLSKNKWKIFILLIFLFFVIIFLSLMNKHNIENAIENKFGIKLEISNIKFGINGIIFKDVRVINENKDSFYSSEIYFKLDYKGTYQYFISNKKLSIIFKEIKISDMSAIFPLSKNSNNLCESPLNISYSNSLNSLNFINITKDLLIIKNGHLSLPNKFEFSFQNESFNVSSNNFKVEMNISSNLNIGRYVSGEIILGDYGKQIIKEDKQTCLILPIESPNNVFY